MLLFVAVAAGAAVEYRGDRKCRRNSRNFAKISRLSQHLSSYLSDYIRDVLLLGPAR